MPQELIALVGGPMDHQTYSVNASEEPLIKLKIADLDEQSYSMAVYDRAEIGPDGLQEYRYRENVIMYRDSLAAAGEDVWALQQFPAGYLGYAVDVGAYDGVSTSNTLLLERKGWTVLCIEPNPAFESPLRQHRKLVELCACASEPREESDFHVFREAPGAYSALNPKFDDRRWRPRPDAPWDIIKVKVERLETLLNRHEFPRLDVLSVDVEGSEIDVLESIDLARWRPKVIIAESWDHVGPIVPYMTEKGYQLADRRDPNNLFLAT